MHGSESQEFRQSASRLAGPRELTPAELAQAYHEAKALLAPSHGFSTLVPAWMDLGLPRRRLEEDVAEMLLEGRIAEHVRARMSGVAHGPAKLSVPIGGVCREFLDVEVRDAVMDRAAAEVPGDPPGVLSFNAALRLLLLRVEKGDNLAAVAGEVAQTLGGGDA